MPFYSWSARTPRRGSQLWGRVLSTRQRELSPAPAFSSSEQDTGTRVTSESFCSACREDSMWGEGSETPRPTGGAPFQPALSGPTWASRKGTPSSSHKEGLSPISLVGGGGGAPAFSHLLAIGQVPASAVQEERGQAGLPRTQKETVSCCVIREGQGGIGVISQHCHCLGGEERGNRQGSASPQVSLAVLPQLRVGERVTLLRNNNSNHMSVTMCQTLSTLINFANFHLGLTDSSFHLLSTSVLLQTPPVDPIHPSRHRLGALYRVS